MQLGFTYLGMFLAVLSGSTIASDIPSSAPNCELKSPPELSGEDFHISPKKFFPRAKYIPPHYTGCQKIWVVFQGEWIPFSTRYFEHGEIKVFLGPLVKGQNQARCFFANGILTAQSTRACPTYDEAKVPSPSLPPGCISEAQSGSPSDRCTRYE
ncbi:MAG: hypothetical protein ACRD6I_19170 [Candidatus Acidiferrales bacterium]